MRVFPGSAPRVVRTSLAALVVGLAGAAPGTGVAADVLPPREDPPPFVGGATPLTPAVRAGMTPSAWRPGCPVGPGALRRVLVTHWDMRGGVRRGVLVVHRDVAAEVLAVFRRLYAERFPIRRIVPVERYGGDDTASVAAGNTSAFNCRRATGSSRWSRHAYGRAIDVNPLENPYVTRGRTIHRASVPYLDRSRVRPGMAVEGGVLVRAFDAAGWEWGGRWREPVDHQHFSADGG